MNGENGSKNVTMTLIYCSIAASSSSRSSNRNHGK